MICLSHTHRHSGLTGENSLRRNGGTGKGKVCYGHISNRSDTVLFIFHSQKRLGKGRAGRRETKSDFFSYCGKVTEVWPTRPLCQILFSVRKGGGRPVQCILYTMFNCSCPSCIFACKKKTAKIRPLLSEESNNAL